MFLSFSAIAGAAAVLMFLTSVVARAAGSSEVAAKATG
jgi:hypothetical protein